MPLLHAIVLGLVQGLSEFIPISSSGHLQLVPWLFGWEDFVGRADLERSFDVALHLGTLVGAIAYFRADIARYLRAGFTEPKGDDGRVAWLLVISAIPAAIVGAVLQDQFTELAEAEWVIGALLIVFGFVLLWADRLHGHRAREDFTLRDALLVGAAQSLALTPGVSRSGVTITTARRLGFDRDAAARLSFLMSLPVIAGALLWEGKDLIGDFPPGFGPAFAWGIAASAVSGWFAVWATLRLVRSRTFTPFVVYRVVAGAAVLVIAASSFR